jgi:hypothetical protein
MEKKAALYITHFTWIDLYVKSTSELFWNTILTAAILQLMGEITQSAFPLFPHFLHLYHVFQFISAWYII